MDWWALGLGLGAVALGAWTWREGWRALHVPPPVDVVPASLPGAQAGMTQAYQGPVMLVGGALALLVGAFLVWMGLVL